MCPSIRSTYGIPPVGAFLGAFGLTIAVLTGVIIRTIWRNQPLPIDTTWHDVLAAHRSAAADAGAQLLNVFGGTGSMVAVTAILIAVLLLCRRWRESITIGVTVAAASGASTAMKLLIARPRPLDGIVDTSSDAFPSGHTTTAAALTVAIALAFPHLWTWFLVVGWVPVMAASRTYLLVHWLTDVAAGALLGVSVALVTAAALAVVFQVAQTQKELKRAPSRTAIAGVEINRAETRIS